MDVGKQIKQIISKWFLKEPLLFSAVSTHTVVPNPSINIPIRTGQMRIEYSPMLLEKNTNEQIEEYLKIEVFRILLEHPYKVIKANTHTKIKVNNFFIVKCLFKIKLLI